MKYWTIFKEEMTEVAWREICKRFAVNPNLKEISFVGEVQDLNEAVKVGAK